MKSLGKVGVGGKGVGWGGGVWDTKVPAGMP